MVIADPILMDTPSSAPAKSSAYKPAVRLSPASVPSAAAPGASAAPIGETLVDISHLDFFYNTSQALHDINLKIEAKNVTAFIGPSGCGKSTLLRCLNRMNDLIDGTRVARGSIKIHGVDIYQPDVDVIELRKRVGMVFQKSNPFPKSIYENITFGLRLQGMNDPAKLDEIVEKSLRIARAIAVEPEVILMDEPCSALDPVATAKVEELIQELRSRFTIIIVTHNMQQAARCSDKTAFFYLGKLIEFADTRDIFTKPANAQTEAYVSGRFG